MDGLDILLLTRSAKRRGSRERCRCPTSATCARYVLSRVRHGNAKNPAWLGNLKATPSVDVQVGAQKLKLKARVTDGEERARIWAQVTRDFPRYLAYQTKTERQIPVVLLEP